MVNIKAKRIQCDEYGALFMLSIKNVPEEMEGKAGDLWTW